MPRLSACVFCSKKPEVQGYFSSLHGGVLCKRCIIRDRQAFVVSAGALRSIEELARLRFDNLARIKLIPAILKELKRLLGEFLEFHLEKRLNSVRFFKKLETMPYWKG